MTKKRLAIIGAGSSGLVSLKYAKDLLCDWDLVCFEKSGSIQGCWGNPYPGFVSTTTKYATQFACFPQFQPAKARDGKDHYPDFFCNDQYGQYLEQFADAMSLREHIRLHTEVLRVIKDPAHSGWTVSWRDLSADNQPAHASDAQNAFFDAVIFCTGLAARRRELTGATNQIGSVAEIQQLKHQRIVVIGGGESAVDFASRLAAPERHNEVYLSLKTGIRVSPRYHPIRGVPSDYLRNRLMLSIHQDLRNWIGQRFVEARIRFQSTFQKLFPERRAKGTAQPETSDQRVKRLRKHWDLKLTRAAKDQLFNMFHNKSDDFLSAVGEGRIQIVGPPNDDACTRFMVFDSDRSIEINPDAIVPSIGYRSTLEDMTNGAVRLSACYLGCVSVSDPTAFVVGFARPVIGNIPTISEMQARLAVSLLSGNLPRPDNLRQQHDLDTERLRRRFGTVDTEAVYPVEMYPYCDRIANLLGEYPTLRVCKTLSRWIRIRLAPATTMHYQLQREPCRAQCDQTRIYLPMPLIVLLLGLIPLSSIYRMIFGPDR